MGLIKSSNSELETLKSLGPFRIQSSDNSNYKSIMLQETIINEPIIIEIEELKGEEVKPQVKEYDFSKLEIKE